MVVIANVKSRNMPTSKQIRQQFIDYFKDKHGHTFAPSSPVVPHDDPTLMFANAGMNQFKPYFLGTEQPPYPRAANTQKCIRAGGKHNDLDDVGKDTYHHTFFEMLGNWSFGDYFKKEAIEWAWDLLVNVWGIEKDRLYASYFEGDESEGLEPDTEARDFWLNFLPADHVVPGNKKDNFWEMGDTGPCGPCSELHYDRSPDKSGAALVNADAQDTVVEIWNLVFIQFNRDTSGKLSPLPNKHVDTGMGFERIVRVLQGKESNYDTDIWSPLFDAIQKVTGARAYEGGEDSLNDPIDVAYRVIADHIRTLTFALADGAHCGNTGRNSVLRTVLRRAVRFGHQQLGVEETFFYKLVPAVVEQMGGFFPEITVKPQAIVDELKEEEESFRATLARGIGIFEKDVEGLRTGERLEGDTAFDLEATYGFPISLTQVMAEERGLTVDMPGYEKAKEKHAEISRGEGGATDIGGELVEIIQRNNPAATEFLGNDTTEVTRETTLQAFALSDGRVAVISDATPFYGEAGGQVGDSGTIAVEGGSVYKVQDTKKAGDVNLHICSVASGIVDVDPVTGDVTFNVDQRRRASIMANHTSTHILNRSLRTFVNPDADQKGSLVDDEKLRFDFSHNAAVTREQIEQVETQANHDIAADLTVYYDNIPIEQGKAINGLRAVFGEKYPDVVRVVSIGVPVKDLVADLDNTDWPNYSIEFCGGTHLAKTGDAEGLVVLSEEGVAKGIRRITALTGSAAHKATAAGEMLVNRVDALKSADPSTLQAAIAEITKTLVDQQVPMLLRLKIQDGIVELQKILKEHDKVQAKAASGNVIEQARKLADEAGDDTSLIVANIEGADGKSLLDAIDVLKAKHPEAAFLLGAATGDKCAFLAVVPKRLIGKGLKAGDWVREVAKAAGGGGGGRPDMAQAGGKDPAKLEQALEVGRAFAQGKL